MKPPETIQIHCLDADLEIRANVVLLLWVIIDPFILNVTLFAFAVFFFRKKKKPNHHSSQSFFFIY